MTTGPETPVDKNMREVAVLTVAEVMYSSILKSELDDAHPDIKAKVMFAAEATVDDLNKQDLLKI